MKGVAVGAGTGVQVAVGTGAGVAGGGTGLAVLAGILATGGASMARGGDAVGAGVSVGKLVGVVVMGSVEVNAGELVAVGGKAGASAWSDRAIPGLSATVITEALQQKQVARMTVRIMKGLVSPVAVFKVLMLRGEHSPQGN